MNQLFITIQLLILIVVGVVFKVIYKDTISNNTLKSFVIKFFLPILLFTAFLEASKENGFFIYLLFGLVYCVITCLLFLLLFWHKSYFNKREKMVFILTASTLAPGLTIYPFIYNFIGRSSLAFASMMDLGVKIYIFGFVYLTLAYAMHRLSITQHSKEKFQLFKFVFLTIKRFILEPVIIAIILGLVLFLLGVGISDISGSFSAFLIKLSEVASVLIMLFIGINLPKKYSTEELLISISLLLIRSGLGLLYASIFCFCFGITGERMLIYIAFTQGAVSLWPYAAIATLKQQYQIESFGEKLTLGTIAFSFPLAILSMLIIFNLKPLFFTDSAWALQLAFFLAGLMITIVFVIIYKVVSIRAITKKGTPT